MGDFRNAQLDLLTNTGQEFIEFKTYDKDGNFKETLQEDVLLTAPDQIIPINNDLIVEYLKPVKKAQYEVEIDEYEDKHPNSHFLYKAYNWAYGISGVEFISPPVNNTANPFPVSKNTYLVCSNSNNASTMAAAKALNEIMVGTAGTVGAPDQADIPNLPEVSQKIPVRIEFDYFADTDSDIDIEIAMEIKYYFISSSTTYDLDFDQDEQKWKYNFNPSIRRERDFVKVQNQNQWQKFSLDLPPISAHELISGVNAGDYTGGFFVDIRLGKPMMTTAHSSDFNQLFVDNFKISEINQTRKTAIMSQESLESKTYSGVYKSGKNILSNELKNTKHDGRIAGSFISFRDDSTVRSIDDIITQEILNDHRTFLKRYEGTFYSTNPEPIPISFHNKIWMNFITEQDPVSCFIDNMEYSVKNNEYKIIMHQPNQDDDVSSVFKILYK